MSDRAGRPTESLQEGVAAPRASSRTLVTTAAIAVILITAIEGTIVATVMPQIVGQLGRFDLFSWVFTAYLLTQAVTIPLYGRLADIYGRKRMLLIAIGLFLLGSLMCGFAGGMVSLIAFRVLQGTGAGGLVPLAQTVVGDMYTPVERARVQGYLSSVWAVGSIVGPLLGAFLVAHTIWPMVFWVNIPIGAIAALLLILWLHEKLQQRQHRIDYGGALLMVAGSGLLMFALVEASHLGAVRATGLLAMAIIILALFVFYERRAAEPMIPLALLRNRVIAAGTLGACALGAIMMGATAFVSLYVQGVMGRGALLAGLVLMTPSVTWPIGSISGGWMMLKTSYRATTLVGTLPLLLGCALMIALSPASGALIATCGVGFIGIGMGLTNNTYTVAIQGSVDWSQRGVATSTMSFMRQVGQSVGAAVFGGTVNAELADAGAGADMVDRIMDPAQRAAISATALKPATQAVAAGLHSVYLITALLALSVLATALLLPKGLSPHRHEA
ncbi:MAG TPA: MDR family MFS transporter [Stellaceae bacterium]|nr:MDR family MFS transporter [Stellaceae bacterium]